MNSSFSFVLMFSCFLFLFPSSSAHGIFEQNGITLVDDKYCPNITFSDPRSDKSLENLASTGANYVAIVVTVYQDSAYSTDIYPVTKKITGPKGYYTFITAKDDDVEHVITKAKDLGLKVFLKPQVDLTKDTKNWRGNIGIQFSENQWTEWFESYTKMLLHYAQIAESLKVDMFSVGCELIATSHRSDQWRKVVSDVRAVFNGKITDSANHDGEEWDKTWWDAVDYIGVDAYYDVGDYQTTVEGIVEFWKDNIIWRLKDLSNKFNKPLLFTEIGYCSSFCSRDNPPAMNETFQKIRYEAMFEAFKGETEWFKGVHWWAWNTDDAFGLVNGKVFSNCITPQWKMSEDVLRHYYNTAEPRPEIPPYDGVSLCTV